MVKRAAVIFGGNSAEREISVLTGFLALRLIDPTRYEAFPLYVHEDGGMYTFDVSDGLDLFKSDVFQAEKFRRCALEKQEVLIFAKKKDRVAKRVKIDVLLNCCHGGAGENGGVSALAEFHGVPSASPSIAACAVSMDKSWTKELFRSWGIPALKDVVLTREEYVRRGDFALKEAAKTGFPLIVKPASSGSSFGISVLESEEEMKKGAENAFLYDDKIIFEPYLREKEDVNCAAYTRKGKICVSEPQTAFCGGVYGFQEKYLSSKRDRLEKAPTLTEETKEKIREYTKIAYARLQTIGVVRVDFLKRGEEIYAGEINAVPGSLAYYLFCERLTDARRFLTDLLEEPFFGAKRACVYPKTGVLKSVSDGGKRGFTGVRL